jgi:uncharacterized protein YjdB
MILLRGLRALAVAAPLVVLASCDDVEAPCVDRSLPVRAVAMNTVPQQLTLAPGDSGIVTAALPAQWTGCDGETHPFRNAVTWHSSNAAVAAVAPIDSLRARVFAVSRGQTTIIATSVEEPNFKGASAVVVTP